MKEKFGKKRFKKWLVKYLQHKYLGSIIHKTILYMQRLNKGQQQNLILFFNNDILPKFFDGVSKKFCISKNFRMV